MKIKETHRITVDLPKEMARELKIYAAKNDINMRQCIVKGIEIVLQGESSNIKAINVCIMCKESKKTDKTIWVNTTSNKEYLVYACKKCIESRMIIKGTQRHKKG